MRRGENHDKIKKRVESLFLESFRLSPGRLSRGDQMTSHNESSPILIGQEGKQMGDTLFKVVTGPERHSVTTTWRRSTYDFL